MHNYSTSTGIGTYGVEEEDVEGEGEGDDEDGEDNESLHQRLQDLHEHYHVNAEEIKPKTTPRQQ